MKPTISDIARLSIKDKYELLYRYNSATIDIPLTIFTIILYDALLFTFLIALKYPHIQDEMDINGRVKASIKKKLEFILSFNIMLETVSLNIYVIIIENIDVIVQILIAVLQYDEILFLSVTVFSDTILVIDSGMPNKESDIKKENIFIINE